MKSIITVAIVAFYACYATVMVANHHFYVAADALYGSAYSLILWWGSFVGVSGGAACVLLHLLRRN